MHGHTLLSRIACHVLCCRTRLGVAISVLLLSLAAPVFAGSPPNVLYVAYYGANAVSTYTIDDHGLLSPHGSVPAGTGPFSITVHPSGRFAYVANIKSLDITVYGIDGTGTLIPRGTEYVGWDPVRSMAIHPSGLSAYVPWYLKLSSLPTSPPPTSHLRTYSIDANGGLQVRADLDVGAIPRAVAADPLGRFVYAATQGSPAYGVSMYRTDATGRVTDIIGPAPSESYPESVTVDPFGRFAYVANSGSDTISTYRIDGTTGRLTPLGPVGAGRYPLEAVVDPTGRFAYVANHDSNDVSMYRVDAAGQLIAQGAAPAGLRPYSVTVDPSGRFAYVANSGSNDVWLYTIEASTGKLTLQGPVASGSEPVAVRAFTPQALQLSLNATNFRGGTTMPLTATITPGSTPQVVDLYVAVQWPDQTLRFLQADAGLTPEPRPLVASWTVVPFAGELLRYTFSGGEPSGLYRWLAAFIEPGTMNILGTIAQAPFTFSP